MFCSECGTQNPDTNQFCKNCGNPFRKTLPAQAPPAVVPAQPVNTPSPAQPVDYSSQPAVMKPVTAAPAGSAVAAPAGKDNKMLVLGIGSAIVSIISWLVYPYLLGILAIILGGIAGTKSGNKKGKAVIIGILGILIGLASIIFNIFYLDLFPA
jgi:hypothetical protein